ncbi:MAG: hypothetical protein K8T91_23795 [Planctomycetes bacterium]|nr:hypothetical protein [Planctomycetota bacterium]
MVVRKDALLSTVQKARARMHTVLTLLLVSAISLQSAFGCCCRAALLMGDVAVQSPADAQHSCCCEQHSPDQSKQSPAPCKCRLDCGSSGAYVSTPKSSLAKPDSLAWFHMPAVASIATGLVSTWSARASATAEPGGRLPLYLVHQLLLL